MHHSVELYLDPASEERIRDLASSIRDRVLPDRVGGRPHLTLAACGHIVLQPEDAPFREMSKPFIGDLIEFSSFGLFPGDRCVCFLAPVVTDRLLLLHRQVHGKRQEISSGVVEYHQPGQWVPHCTLVDGLTYGGLTDAFTLANSFALPMIAQIADVAVRKYPSEAHPPDSAGWNPPR